MTPNCSNWKVKDPIVYDAHAAPVRNKKSVECLLDETYEKLAGTELGQAQLKLGLGFTSTIDS